MMNPISSHKEGSGQTETDIFAHSVVYSASDLFVIEIKTAKF